jgi:hypothetical protein
MNPQENEKAEAWARRKAELGDGCSISVGGLYVKAKKFPPPDTTNMTPAEADGHRRLVGAH